MFFFEWIICILKAALKHIAITWPKFTRRAPSWPEITGHRPFPSMTWVKAGAANCLPHTVKVISRVFASRSTPTTSEREPAHLAPKSFVSVHPKQSDIKRRKTAQHQIHIQAHAPLRTRTRTRKWWLCTLTWTSSKKHIPYQSHGSAVRAEDQMPMRHDSLPHHSHRIHRDQILPYEPIQLQGILTQKERKRNHNEYALQRKQSKKQTST